VPAFAFLILCLLFILQLSSDDAQTTPRRSEPTARHSARKSLSEDIKLDSEQWSEGIFPLLPVSLSVLHFIFTSHSITSSLHGED